MFDLGPGRTVEDTITDGFTTATVVLLDDPRLEIALALLRAGASAVLARQSDERELLAAIDAAATGLLVLDATAREGLATLGRSASNNAAALTGREREVLNMLARASPTNKSDCAYASPNTP